MKPVIASLLFALLSLSAPAQPAGRSAMPMLKTGHAEAFTLFTQPRIAFGLALINPPGFDAELREEQGFTGAVPSERSPEPSLYFQTAAERIVTATGTFFVSVQFFDEGQGALELEYVSAAGGELRLQRDRIFLGDSGSWQQHVFTLSAALLNRALAGGADFRLVCPDIPIRRVGISRVPPPRMQLQGRAVSGIFDQEPVNPPSYLWIGVSVDGLSDDDWLDAQLVEEKARLYRSWGAPYVIDDIDLSRKPLRNRRVDFSAYEPRLDLCSALDAQWTPRFQIGFLPRLPGEYATQIQRAVGVERNSEGPMASLWDPKLFDVYADIFSDMRTQLRVTRINAAVLSFAGDWGPLLMSSGRGRWNGWPDIWAGDPLARAAFIRAMRSKYASVAALNSVWGTGYQRWDDVEAGWSEDGSHQRNYDVISWYRQSMTAFADRMISLARGAMPNAKLVIEIGDEAIYSAVDARDFAALARKYGASLVTVTDAEPLTESWHWQWMANACRRLGVEFGLKLRSDGARGLLGAIYSMQSEGGRALVVSEDELAGEDVWATYKDAMRAWRRGSPERRIAVIAPRIELAAQGALEFDTLVGGLRERFAFDVIDEADLSTVNASRYPLVFVLWGEVWSGNALNEFERIARSGSLLAVHADSPWRTLDGDVDINERIFAVELERINGEWVIKPRGNRVKPQERNPRGLGDRRVVDLGAQGDRAYLSGHWGQPGSASMARRLGFNDDAFRWMGERGRVFLPVRPGGDYTLHVDAFIPEGRTVRVFINRDHFGDIEGEGPTRWSKTLDNEFRIREPEVEVMFRGQLWRTGEVVGATQSYRVSMAAKRVALLPRGESLDQADGAEDDGFARAGFGRESLRASWLREVGQGHTLFAPDQYVSQWMFESLIATVVESPELIDPRFQFTLPPDGESNGVYVSPQSGFTIYLNLNDDPVELAGSGRRVIVPPNAIYYSN